MAELLSVFYHLAQDEHGRSSVSGAKMLTVLLPDEPDDIFLFLLHSGIFVYSLSLHNYCSSSLKKLAPRKEYSSTATGDH